MLFPPPRTDSDRSRVVITGAGLITPHGAGWTANAEGFRLGRVALGPITRFDVARQRVKTGGEVSLPELDRGRLSEKSAARLDRAGRLLLAAASEAWRQAGWESGDQALPLVLGTTSGGMSLGETFYRQAVSQPHANRGQPTRVVQYQAQRQAQAVCEALGIRGPVMLIANACASGANAIGSAWEMIRDGRFPRVLTGGYDALCQLVFSGFDSLQALSPTRCRPFDASRDGLSLGEGAGILALETLDFARSRGASILGEITGYAAATDAHHLTQPHPRGDTAFACMTGACRMAGVAPEQIGYLNAHGTGTPLNDSAETAAINRWAGRHRVSVSSTKSGIGHLLGAAGAVEAIVCLMALREGWLPPQTTLEMPDPACGFPIPTRPTEARITHALTNSFGFGGSNASLVLRRWA